MLRLSTAIRIALAAAALAASGALAQDPLLLLPHAYRLELENDWVKVVRVRYAPRETLEAHDHTQAAAAYVYLNDAGPVIFKHDYGAVTRPPTKAGSFRLYKAVREIHEVENPNSTPSEFVRVEFKTDPVDDRTLFGRFHRQRHPAGEGFEKVQFENEQLRVTRAVVAPRQRLVAATNAEEPALLIALTPGALESHGSRGEREQLGLEPGRALWLAAGERRSLENLGVSPVELLRFDLKTKPLAP